MPVLPLELPLLAVAPNPRRVGVACLDKRLESKRLGVICVRRFRCGDTKAECVRRQLERLVVTHGVKTLVIEANASEKATEHRRSLERAAKAIAKKCRIRIEHVSFRAATNAIADGSLMGTVRVLARRYEKVRRRYGPKGPCQYLKTDRERDFRPVVVALAIAHACGLASFRG